MLVLSRSKDEAVIVGQILLKVAKINGDVAHIEVSSEGVEKKTHVLRKNESLDLIDNSKIVLIEIRSIGDREKIRIGVEADRNTPVHRKEVWDAIQREAAIRREAAEN